MRLPYKLAVLAICIWAIGYAAYTYCSMTKGPVEQYFTATGIVLHEGTTYLINPKAVDSLPSQVSIAINSQLPFIGTLQQASDGEWEFIASDSIAIPDKHGSVLLPWISYGNEQFLKASERAGAKILKQGFGIRSVFIPYSCRTAMKIVNQTSGSVLEISKLGGFNKGVPLPSGRTNTLQLYFGDDYYYSTDTTPIASLNLPLLERAGYHSLKLDIGNNSIAAIPDSSTAFSLSDKTSFDIQGIHCEIRPLYPVWWRLSLIAMLVSISVFMGLNIIKLFKTPSTSEFVHHSLVTGLALLFVAAILAGYTMWLLSGRYTTGREWAVAVNILCMTVFTLMNRSRANRYVILWLQFFEKFVEEYVIEKLNKYGRRLVMISFCIAWVLVFKTCVVRESLGGVIPVVHGAKFVMMGIIIIAGHEEFKKTYFWLFLLVCAGALTKFTNDFSTVLFNTMAIVCMPLLVRHKLNWLKSSRFALALVLILAMTGAWQSIRTKPGKAYRLVAAYVSPDSSLLARYAPLEDKQSAAEQRLMLTHMVDNNFKGKGNTINVPHSWRNVSFSDYAIMFNTLIFGYSFLLLYAAIAAMIIYSSVILILCFSFPFDIRNGMVHSWNFEKVSAPIYLLLLTVLPFIYCTLATFLCVPLVGISAPGIVPSTNEVIFIWILLILLFSQICNSLPSRLTFDNERVYNISVFKHRSKIITFVIIVSMTLLISLRLGLLVYPLHKDYQRLKYEISTTPPDQESNLLAQTAAITENSDSLYALADSTVRLSSSKMWSLGPYTTSLLNYTVAKAQGLNPLPLSTSTSRTYPALIRQLSYTSLYINRTRPFGNNTVKAAWALYNKKGKWLFYSRDIILAPNNFIQQIPNALPNPVITNASALRICSQINGRIEEVASDSLLTGAPPETGTINALLHSMTNIVLAGHLQWIQQQTGQPCIGTAWVISHNSGEVLTAASYPILMSATDSRTRKINTQLRGPDFNVALYSQDGYTNVANSYATVGSVIKMVIAYVALRIDYEAATRVYKKTSFDQFVAHSDGTFSAHLLKDIILPNADNADSILKNELDMALYTDGMYRGLITSKSDIRGWDHRASLESEKNRIRASAIGQRANIDAYTIYRAYLRIATGKKISPTFYKPDGQSTHERLPDNKALQRLHAAMQGVIDSGTAAKSVGAELRKKGILTIGFISKTGTAQRKRNGAVYNVVSSYICCVPEGYTIGITILSPHLDDREIKQTAKQVFIELIPILQTFNIIK